MSVQLTSKGGPASSVAESEYDEFANPAEFRPLPPAPPFSERLKKQLRSLPVFPIGMAGFLSIAGYGIYKYQSLPMNDSIAKTVYFTRLRIMAQGFAVGVIAMGAVHAWYKDYSWTKSHPNEPHPN